MAEAGKSLQGKVVDGRFHLGRYLGGSERSAVFLTERLQGTPRTAAIKLIPADPATADLQLSRWKLISRLTHPHILEIYEAGRWRLDGQDVLYVVMEYAGENLGQVLPGRSLTPDETLEMLKPTIESLAYLHGRGFVHGHIKPSNVMVAGEQLKLASDGICRIGELDGTKTGAYGPSDLPEKAAAPARDIWSLGVMIVQVLTQLLPVRNGDGSQGVTLPATLPSQFADLVRGCLEPDPKRRSTLAEIAERLHFELPARTIGPPPRPVQSAAPERQATTRLPRPGANRYISLVHAVVIILALAAIVGGLNFFGSSSQPDNPASAIEPSPLPPAVPSAAPELPLPKLRTESTRPVATRSQIEAPARPELKTASEASRIPPPPSLKPRETSPAGPLVPGEVVRQVLPDVPRGASYTIRGTVRVTVRVRVNPAGDVAGVTFVSAGPSPYFARLASDAARQWNFSPARRDGHAAASTWNIQFQFTRGGIRAIPVAAP